MNDYERGSRDGVRQLWKSLEVDFRGGRTKPIIRLRAADDWCCGVSLPPRLVDICTDIEGGLKSHIIESAEVFEKYAKRLRRIAGKLPEESC